MSVISIFEAVTCGLEEEQFLTYVVQRDEAIPGDPGEPEP